MDYVESFKNLRTNNKYGRKSPHKAVMMLTVIELYEKNILTDNEIYYDETLKSMYLKVWNKVLPKEQLFHPEAFFPYWYLQSDHFWHIVPKRGEEDILSLMRDSNIKPSESRLYRSVQYAELDNDLYFMMTMPSGRKALKRAILETYTDFSEHKIERMTENVINIESQITSVQEKIENMKVASSTKYSIENNEEEAQLENIFRSLNRDLQIALNYEYYSFLNSHREDREWFLELNPSVSSLYNHIVYHPLTYSDMDYIYVSTYERFLSELRISLMSENCAFDVVDHLSKAIECLHDNPPIDYSDSYDKIIEVENDNSINNIVQTALQTTTIEDDKEDSDHFEVEHVFLDSRGKIIEKISSSQLDISAEDRRGKSWTKEEEELIARYFQQGMNTATIAENLGRTEVAIKSRLAKLGLIEYTYGQEDKESINKEETKLSEEDDFRIENGYTRCSIFNKDGEKVFSEEGKLKYIGGKLYRLKLKNVCFTIKSMRFNGSVWIKGEKKIVAYPQSKLYRILDSSVYYIEDVEDIVDNPVFENCKLKVKGIWYKYNGDLVTNENENTSDALKRDSDKLRILKSPLYAVRKQAVLRAMSFFRLPAKIKDIARTISKTAWRSTIKEEDVEDIINTMSDVESVDGGYILRKKH